MPARNVASAPHPSGLTPLGKVGQAMNFQQLRAEGPTVLVTMDHRAVLVAAWAAKRQRLFPCPPLLLRLDAHPDMGERPRPWAYEKALLTDLDSVSNIVNSTRLDDGGWVLPAMQWGLCSSVYTAFVHDYHRFPGDCESYRDHLGINHPLFTSSEILPALDRFEKAQADDEDQPTWVDIDLDFATTRLDDGTPRPWTPEEWEALFPEDSRTRFAEAATNTTLVTISLEPWFCGGLEACGKIARAFENAMAPFTEVFMGLA